MADDSSWLDQHAEQARERLARISAIRAELAGVQATGRSPDNLVTATINGHGRLTGVEIADQAIRRGDAEALGTAVVAAVNAAFAAVLVMNRERVSGLVDFSAYDQYVEQLTGPDVDEAPPVIRF